MGANVISAAATINKPFLIRILGCLIGNPISKLQVLSSQVLKEYYGGCRPPFWPKSATAESGWWFRTAPRLRRLGRPQMELRVRGKRAKARCRLKSAPQFWLKTLDSQQA